MEELEKTSPSSLIDTELFKEIWFGWVSLFNGILTFVGYSVLKTSLYKNSNGLI